MTRTAAILLAFALAGCGCTSIPSHDDLRATNHRLKVATGMCSGTAVGPDLLVTALHCGSAAGRQYGDRRGRGTRVSGLRSGPGQGDVRDLGRGASARAGESVVGQPGRGECTGGYVRADGTSIAAICRHSGGACSMTERWSGSFRP